MPFISDTASAIKSRFGFHDHTAPEPAQSVRGTPGPLKSASKENFSLCSSAVRSIGTWDSDDGLSNTGAGTSVHSFEVFEDPAFWKDHNVQVIIRVRPLSTAEISLQGYSKCVRQDSCQTITWTGHPESRFTFDVVADESISQEKLFKVAGLPMVENCMGGYNSCMFAYGQTGSGKTHTMLGDIEGGTRRHSVNCGMTPRVFEHLFSRIQKEKEARRDEKLRFTCKCSFLEIYNEQILDLLDPSSNNLQIREDTKKGVYVESLKEIEVTSARDVIQQLIQGSANRKVAATNMNRASSRSHSVFTCIIESKWESQGVTHHRFARLNLVDLAGSERQKSSGAEGERLKEATNINKSLSTLGLVIMNLVNISNGKSLHVPYRDSKLTFLLQDSLGGNSKTTIIANISPSSCCSLETLSTLKFAQRAKFIKNNAIVNEDTSGDVIAMRIQIQQLKKEVSHLRGLVSGAENQENDSLITSFPGSPGSFKWEGLHGSSSPLTSSKRISQRKDYEVALVGAFRREKDKDIAFEALTAENQAAVQLAKQREDEIQGLKMRLRFREAAIKRLEAVASGKISAETHLLKEKEEQLKEIEVLRAQVDRNQEVTRFAMENLRLKEEIRRLKSFYEEGEREMMNEQIMVLENKLLEALDWKLMHESNPPVVEKANSEVVMEDVDHDGKMLTYNKPVSPWRSEISEENKFLRMQAIQNQAEIDTLHRKLDLCIEEKEKLERHVNDLVAKLEEERTSRTAKEGTPEVQLPSVSTDVAVINLTDQMELKTMVDAIAAASQREAEAHETAIMLSKENDELRMKLKILIEDNNKLIELYERATAESIYTRTNKSEDVGTDVQSSDFFSELGKDKIEMKNVVESLKHQLLELNEENEKLMGLYEKAMQERDEIKRLLSSSGQRRVETKLEIDCPEKLVEVDGIDQTESAERPISKEVTDLTGETALPGLNLQDRSNAFEKPSTPGAVVFQVENEFSETTVQVGPGLCAANSERMMENQANSQADLCHDSDGPPCFVEATMSLQVSEELVESIKYSEEKIPNQENDIPGLHPSVFQVDFDKHTDDETLLNVDKELSNLEEVKPSEDLNLVRLKLVKADELLLDSAKSITKFGSLETAIIEVDRLSIKIDEMEDGLKYRRQQYESLKLTTSEIKERGALIDRKLSALKYSLFNFSTSVAYFEQREARARSRVTASTSYLDRKKDEFACLKTQKHDIETAQCKIQQSEIELRNNIAYLKSKLEEENRKQENEKVLFTIDNVEKVDPTQKLWHLGGKATELLKSEEEKTKLQTEMKLSRERLPALKMESEDLKRKHEKVDIEMQAVQAEIQKGLTTVEEMGLALQVVLQEKEMLLEISATGKNEIESMILELQQHIFEADLKESEMKIVEEEMQMELRTLEQLRTSRSTATKDMTRLLEGARCHSTCLSERMGEELQSIRASVLEAKSLLGEDNTDS